MAKHIPPRSLFISVETLEKLNLERGWRIADLAQETGLGIRTIEQYSLSPDNLLSVARAHSVLPSSLVDWAQVALRYKYSAEDVAAIKVFLDQRMRNQRAANKAANQSSSSQPLQERKNVILKPSLSTDLMSLERVPALIDAVQGTAMLMPMHSEEKDIARVRDFNYNHFLQIGILVEFKHSNGRYLIGGQRIPQPHLPGYRHTQGAAVLWATGFRYRDVEDRGREPMDSWVEQWSHDSDLARRSMTWTTLGRIPVLFKLFDGKFDLIGRTAVVTPFGVITNDQRGSDGSGRVYTQYVFLVQITADATEDVEQLARQLVLLELTTELVNDAIDPVVEFSHQGKPHAMDVLAWTAWNCDVERDQFESARFRRGFEIA